ncbi:MAG: proton-conducting transporter membrane subunit [Nitriliruptoraceae bacterium]
MNATIAIVLGLPVAGIALTAVSSGRARARSSLVLAAGIAGSVLLLARSVLADGATHQARLRLPIGGEVALVADGLAVSLLVMTAVVGLAVVAFAWAEIRREPDRYHRAYWSLLFALWAGIHLLLLAGDLFTVYLMLEVVGLCGSLLVTLRGDRGSVLAGTRYFYAELVASTTMLLGVAVVWAQAGTVVFSELAVALEDAPLASLGLAIMTIGLLLKAPLAPLHFWLPAAHTLAPSAVSPLLSGVMVKVAFAVLVRLWFLSVPDLITTPAAQLIGALGALAILWGSFGGLLATGLKRLIASSTVAQVGLLFLLVPLVAAGSADGWTGGVVLALSHAAAKGAMLMAAAVLVDSARAARTGAAGTGSITEGADPDSAAGVGAAGGGSVTRPDRVAGVQAEPSTVTRGETTWPLLMELRGSATRRPIAMMAFGIASISLVGLPPSGGFVAKWYLLVASITTGQWWWVVVLVAGTLLTVGYLMRFVRPAFAPLPENDQPVPRRDARDLVALALATSTLALGLFPGPLLELLAIGGPHGGG